jgi:hypothetical protein
VELRLPLSKDAEHHSALFHKAIRVPVAGRAIIFALIVELLM